MYTSGGAVHSESYSREWHSAIATWAANTERDGPLATAGVLDRAAAAPITRGETAYERAVREAIAGERAAAKRTAS